MSYFMVNFKQEKGILYIKYSLNKYSLLKKLIQNEILPKIILHLHPN